MVVDQKEASIEIPDVFLNAIATCLLTDGGPGCRGDEIDEDLRLFMGNRPEHFKQLTETVRIDGRELRIFQWTQSAFSA